ncbi:uncharacterized protein LOC111064791 [Drosophila obscura]|uniref:uncharacterized protein LOC111064791 n=1 Tax=Drosophila obscura TaxID=7282 RepID=UPI001BB2A121|nr:uncharacterized protein LOC111064791 [Drosophila obscura]
MLAIPNILDLPLDLISLIFSHIQNLEDRLQLAQVHSTLANGFAYYASNAHRMLDCDELPISYWSKILYHAGASVLTITLRNKAHIVALLKLASDHCPNVEELQIPVRSEFWSVIVPLLLSLKKLCRIGLRNDFRAIDFIDTLHEFPGLRSLFLIGFPNESLIRVNELRKLTSLRIVNSEPIDIYAWFAPLRNLITLEVKVGFVKCPDHLDGKRLWPKMKYLNFTYGIFLSELPYLPKLKQLGIAEILPAMKLSQMFGKSLSKYANTLRGLRILYDNQTIDADDAKTISELKALKHVFLPGISNRYIGLLKSDQLQELYVRDSNHLTNSGILRVLRGCKNLRVIDFFGCKYINKHVVGPALKILKENGVKLDNPVELRVNMEFGNHISLEDLKLLIITRSTADGQLI